ncbi:class I SAM-dependent methyltransferase [Legionella sp. PATHC035]|uniref:class I SAM-dependent methyltransferase n=1 Tax=Legionella sp. PATHC035 TaxID=2992040 RepID=UPI0022431A47|nr:class I SAM-dependent methyltransferase [Legionella sp. PATHC035]MCW8408912.1 class I SAM-dependent methyltransferase [Legionella sp. PATHC035]
MPHRWCDSAQLRKKQIESGIDITFNDVFKPIFIEMIQDLNPQKILEIGGGTGHLSLTLSEFTSQILMIEPSTGMYEVATEVLSKSNVRILKIKLEELEIKEKYDLIISHMVLHTITNIDNFFRQVTKYLNNESIFVFSIPHPCFYNQYKNIFNGDYNYMREEFKNISFTITKDEKNLITNVPYNHRPISTYINTLTKNNLNLKKMKEIYPSQEIQMLYGALWKEPRYCLFVCGN